MSARVHGVRGSRARALLVSNLAAVRGSPPGTMGVDSVDAVGGELQLDSWVTAHLVDGSSHRGVLHTVDPETGTVILLKPEGVSLAPHRGACCRANVALLWRAQPDPDVVRPLAIFNHAIASIEQHGDPPPTQRPKVSLEPLRVGIAEELDTASIAARREAICDMLRRHRVPFELSGPSSEELHVLSCLRVSPPYSARTCHCENEIVLGRFLSLLQQCSEESEAFTRLVDSAPAVGSVNPT